MNPEWQQFLQQIGASGVSFAGTAVDPGAATHEGLLADLSKLVPLECSGRDAGQFLNAQFTSDINQLPDGAWQYSAWCNPQGRVLATFIVFRVDAAFLLLLPASLKDMFLKRLRIYVLRSDVLINDRSDELVCTGLLGNDRMQPLPGAPQITGQVARRDGLSLLCVAGAPTPRLLAVGPVADMQSLWRSLQGRFTTCDSGPWECRDISAGVPWVGETTSGLFLPQELDLDLMGGLSYSKGCFPGQEVIARLHFRGKVKQRLHRCTSSMDLPAPVPGEKLYAQTSENAAGAILNVADSGQGEYAILAVANLELAAAGSLHLEHNPDLSLRLATVGRGE